eukprot:PhF_6_TR40079/c0_g1_i1/m.59436
MITPNMIMLESSPKNQPDWATIQRIDRTMWLTFFGYPLLSTGKFNLLIILLFTLPFVWDVVLTDTEGSAMVKVYYDGCIRDNEAAPYEVCLECNRGDVRVTYKNNGSNMGLIIFVCVSLYLLLHRYTLRRFQNVLCCLLLGHGVYVRPNVRGVWLSFLPIGVIAIASTIWNGVKVS